MKKILFIITTFYIEDLFVVIVAFYIIHHSFNIEENQQFHQISRGEQNPKAWDHRTHYNQFIVVNFVSEAASVLLLKWSTLVIWSFQYSVSKKMQ